ncbi:MAG: hypothetical protein RJB66_1788 [Pseudomonadota bacterium]|jgi:pimeloyl-ACP methyl ester carboxylesterase
MTTSKAALFAIIFFHFAWGHLARGQSKQIPSNDTKPNPPLEAPIDWPKDGQIDYCPNTNAFDYRNAFWMAAASYYSYVEPRVLKQLVDAPLGQRVRVTTYDKEGKPGPSQMMFGLGWSGHFDFFTSKPILPKNYRSKAMNIISLFGKRLPYEACIKKENPSKDGNDDDAFEITCEQFRHSRDLPPDVQALWLDGPNALMLAFRGTEIDNPIDWVTDLSTSMPHRQKSLPFWKRQVHKGFLSAYTALSQWLFEEIDDFIARYPNASQTPVFITGHSMGGAIATIVTAALLERNLNVSPHQRLNIKALYTFGSPRVGSQIFTEYFQALQRTQGVGVYRIVNKNDIVTKAPCFDYRHLGTHVQLFADVQGNFPATNVNAIVNPTSDGFNYCAYGTKIVDSLDNFSTYALEHSLESYYSVLVKARHELKRALKKQADDYQKRFGTQDETQNPYTYPNNCERKRIYTSDSPPYLQYNYRHFPLLLEK